MNSIISLCDISKVYHTKGGDVNALSHINLEIERGSFTAIVGQSGSGKSTLMNILGCLDTPTDGEYYLDGEIVSSMKEKQLSFVRNNVIGFVFQSFNLIPTLNALENVELPLIYRRTERHERHERSVSALERVGLAERMTHRPNQLSGGQQQRVAIARAIATSPQIILADEPTGNLDRKSGNEILDILKEMNRNGVTIILITHDNEIAKKAENCIRISDGKLISNS